MRRPRLSKRSTLVNSPSGVLACSALLHLIARLRKFYRYSAIAAFFACFSRLYDGSRFRIFWQGLLGAPAGATKGSWFFSQLRSMNSFLARLGRQASSALSGGAVAGASRAVQNTRAWRGSFLLSLLFGGGMKRLIILVFSLYLPADFILRELNVPFLATGWDEAFLIFGLLYVFFRMVLFGRERGPRTTPLDAPMLLFMAASFFLMCVVCPNPDIAFDGLRAVIQYMVWFFVLTRLFEDRQDALLFVLILALIGAVVALHGIYQFIVRVPIPQNWVSVYEQGVPTRVFSIFGSPNVMGSFMIMTAPLAAAFAYYAKKMWQKIAAWAAVGAMCLALVFTFSRGAWFGMGVTIAVFALYRDRRLFGFVGAGAGIAVFIPSIANRITFLFTSDFQLATNSGGRAQRWAYGMDLLRYNGDIFGYGLGRFGGAVAMQNQIVEGLTYFYLDNYYLKIFVEMGYIGLISFLLLIGALVWNSMRAIFRTDGRESMILQGAAAGMAGVLMHSMYENIFEVPYMNAYFWGLAAVIMSVGFLLRQKETRA